MKFRLLFEDDVKADPDLESENEANLESEKIYEDNEVLVVSPKSFNAAFYYAAGTRWFPEDSYGNRSEFNRYKLNGELYFFINKATGNKLFLYISNNGKSPDIYDEYEDEIRLSELHSSFPNQTDLIDNLTNTGNYLKALRQFSRGLISKYDLEEYDDTLTVSRVKTPLGQSVITIDFENDEEFFDILDLYDGDRYILNAIYSYHGYDLHDSYTIAQDAGEGYLNFLYNFDDDNMETFTKIANILLPGEEFNTNNEEYLSRLYKKLEIIFPKEAEHIIDEYVDYTNRAVQENASESIEKEFEEELNKIGFTLTRKFDMIATTPANLIMFGTRYKLDRLNAKEMFKELLKIYNINLGGWENDMHNYDSGEHFDKVRYNSDIERILENIMTKLEEMVDENGISLQDFITMVNKITSKFKTDKWYELPKDPEITFKITAIDPNDSKITLNLSHKEKGFNKVKLSEDNFYKLLYQPELFEIEFY